MKNLFAVATTKILLAAAMLLSGCSTLVTDVKKDERYTKRLTETSVVWSSSAFMGASVTRSHGQWISEKDRERSTTSAAELQALFARALPDIVPATLRKYAVSVQPDRRAAATQLRIAPVSAETECAPLGCKDSLWLDVQLFDREERRTVWSGRFKVGAPFPVTNDAAVVQSFADSLVSHLKSSGLL